VKTCWQLWACGLSVALVLAAASEGVAREVMPVERLDLQAKLLQTVIRFSTQVPEQLGVAIVYAPEAEQLAREFHDELSKLEFNHRPIQASLLAPEQLDTLEQTINVLYVTPGNADSLDALTAVANRRGIFTATGIPEYVETQKLALAFGEYQQNPQIILGLSAGG
jgi:hypothetical protein